MSFSLCHKLFRRRPSVCRRCSTVSLVQNRQTQKKKGDKHTTSKSQILLYLHLSRLLYLCWTASIPVERWLHTGVPVSSPQRRVRASFFWKLTQITQKWQKSAIRWDKFLQKNLEMQLAWSFKTTNNQQAILKMSALKCPLKNSSQTLASTL